MSEPSFSIPPKASKTLTIKNCDCPTGTADSIHGNMIIQDGACGNTVQIALYTNPIARLVNSPGTLGLAALGVFAIMICLVVIVALAKRHL